jgi:uncharacterized SAM-binding protein YcdF (DUF218 family)
MRDLAVALGVSPERVILDSESRSTRDSASHVAALARRMGASRVHLVTSALHMRRAAWAFSSSGSSVCRHPVDWKQVPLDLPGGLVPQISALDKSTQAVREVAGLVWYRIRPD